jgi:primosomal replication protein N
LVLAHQSEASEDGQARQVRLELKAVAIGAISKAVQSMGLETPAQLAGFLAAGRNGRGLIFHITALEPSPTNQASLGVHHAPSPR